MPPPTRSEQRIRDLSRVRQNQQRSRERKRAYVAELEAKIARLLSHGTSGQTVRNENHARQHFLRDLGVADSAQERYIQAYVAGLTPSNGDRSKLLLPSVALSNKADSAIPTLSFVPGLSKEAADYSLNTPSFILESMAIRSPLKAVVQPAQPKNQALFQDPRSLGLIEPLPMSDPVGFHPKSLNEVFDGSMTDGTTVCPIAFNLILQNNVRGYSFARLESKLLVGYQTEGNEGTGCRILNEVLFAVLAEISQGRVDEPVESNG